MYKKLTVLLLTVFLLSLSLTGCLRPASTAPSSVKAVGSTPTSQAAFPQATQQEGSVQSILSQTQTAAAPGGATGVAEATSTKHPKVTATPKPTKTKQPAVDKSSFQPNLNPERPATYTLKSGEYPICIARRYNLDVPTLLSLNNLSMDSRPKAGTKLHIPQSGSWNLGSRALHDHPAQYTVKSGDTFYTIACYFGNLMPDDIATYNSMSLSDKPKSGTVLDIP